MVSVNTIISMAVLSILAFVKKATGDCVSGGGYWKDDVCYTMDTTTVSWDDAVTVCSGLPNGADLASFSDQATFDDVALQAILASGEIDCSVFWTGLNDKSTEETWVWTDGTPNTWEGWASGLPLSMPIPDVHIGPIPVTIDLDYDCAAGTILGLANMFCNGDPLPAGVSFPTDGLAGILPNMSGTFDFEWSKACPLCAWPDIKPSTTAAPDTTTTTAAPGPGDTTAAAAPQTSPGPATSATAPAPSDDDDDDDDNNQGSSPPSFTAERKMFLQQIKKFF